MKTTIDVQETTVTVFSVDEEDYISLTDIARHKSNDPFIVVCNWMRNRNTIEYLGLWETLYNPDFKPIEFDRFRMEAGLNAFTLSPQKWINATGARGIISRSGKSQFGAYTGGTSSVRKANPFEQHCNSPDAGA